MADWQGELRALLASLDVSLDPDPSVSNGRTRQNVADNPAYASGRGGDHEIASDGEVSDHPPEGIEVSAVRSEMEATLERVVSLVQSGHMERTLRDDVIYVLRALTRPGPEKLLPRAARQAARESAQEWNLASAAAVLHFCRIVLRLTQAIEDENDIQ
ncbi:MAG TPA: hypothetical protein VGP82_11495 [Ktedonobacterales bacterium]|nr:hypothetical protein [Ktedonobacterales bacterium]